MKKTGIVLGVVCLLIGLSCKKTELVATGEAKYDPDVKMVMNNYCITCHSGPAASAGLDLSTYTGVRFATENGNLLDRINDPSSPMPPSGLMPNAERQTLTNWSQGGFVHQ